MPWSPHKMQYFTTRRHCIRLSTSFKSKPLTSSSLKNTQLVAMTAYSITPAAQKPKRSVIGTASLDKTPGANGRSIRRKERQRTTQQNRRCHMHFFIPCKTSLKSSRTENYSRCEHGCKQNAVRLLMRVGVLLYMTWIIVE